MAGPTSGGGFGALIQPIEPSVDINAGASVTWSPDVYLHLFCKYAGEVQIVNQLVPQGDPWPDNTPWVPYVDRLQWTLQAGPDGPRNITARYRAYAGNISNNVYAEIDLNTSMTPTGTSGLCMYNLQWLLSNCPSWQAWLGVATPEEARLRIHRYVYPTPPAQIKWPFMLITEPPSDDYVGEGGGGPYSYVNTQMLNVLVEAQPEVDIKTVGYEAAIVMYKNRCDAIMAEARALSCTDGFFCVEEMSQGSMVSVPDPTALEDVDEDGDLDEATSIQCVYSFKAQGKG